MDEMQSKYLNLKRNLKGMKSVVVAFSGGVDSTFLLKAAVETLGKNVAAVTATGKLFSTNETEATAKLVEAMGARHISFEFDVEKLEGFAENPPDRCYLCKKALMGKILSITEMLSEEEDEKYTLVEGSNVDDLSDYRPGTKAIRELKIKSPLLDADLSKNEIRQLSKLLGLPTWDLPSAACLASRFQYNERISFDKLKMVDEGEKYLKDLGFRQVRIRVHGELARIEVMADHLEKLMSDEVRVPVTKRLKELGFSFVTADMIGYRTGSMNELLDIEREN